MSTDRPARSDKELWRSLATGPNVSTGPVSDVDFAAWLEGRLSEEDAVRIEAAVAASSEMRRAALELAEVLGQPLPAAPARLEARAKALVGFEIERSADRAGLFAWLFFGRRFDFQRVAALAAAVVIAISGFMLGGGLGESLAQERYASITRYGATDTSNELTEFLTSGGL